MIPWILEYTFLWNSRKTVGVKWWRCGVYCSLWFLVVNFLTKRKIIFLKTIRAKSQKVLVETVLFSLVSKDSAIVSIPSLFCVYKPKISKHTRIPVSCSFDRSCTWFPKSVVSSKICGTFGNSDLGW